MSQGNNQRQTKKLYNESRREDPEGQRGVPLTMPSEQHGVPVPSTVQNSHSPKSASLEGLAVELQLDILRSVPDTASLNALVHASPWYHGVYFSQRHSILAEVLWRELSPDVFLDSMMAIEAQGLDHSSTDIEQQVSTFLDRYKARRDFDQEIRKAIPPDNIIKMAQLHSLIRDETQDFCEWALSKYPGNKEATENHGPISSHESCRIYRAFYRLKLFCLIFRGAKFVSPSSFDRKDRSYLFLRSYQPWEVEEIACVRDYLMNRYERLFKVQEDKLVRFCNRDYSPGDSSLLAQGFGLNGKT